MTVLSLLAAGWASLASAAHSTPLVLPLNGDVIHRSALAEPFGFEFLPGTDFVPLSQWRHGNGDTSVYAVSGEGEAFITIGPTGVMGQVEYGGRRWQLVTDADGARALPLDQDGLSWNQCPGPRPSPLRKAAAPTPLSDLQTGEDDPVGTVIDVLVIYNDAMAARYPGDLIGTRINHFVALANQGFANSALNLGVRLVGLEHYPYRNDNTNGEAADDMAFTLSGDTRPGLEGLSDQRNRLGADLVILFRPHEIETRGSCGIAFFPDEQFNPALGVNVVSDGMSSWSICFDDVMTHEIGHNLGAAHQVGFGGGGFDSRGAAFVQPGQYTTVMASFGTGRPDRFRGLNLFSNPAVTCGGAPCGDELVADNSAVLRDTMAQIASYRDAVSVAPVPGMQPFAESDADGDGVIDWNDRFPFDASEQVDSDDDGTGDVADAFPFNPRQNRDNDGDRIGDARDDDDDNDGVNDEDDAFPLDARVAFDRDADGVGDALDAFPDDPFEFRDTDNDGKGDHVDPDDDDDGWTELAPGAQDLLVVSAGNDRILRFDAQTGESRGIEVLDSGVMTFQSALAWRDSDQRLLYTADSALMRQGGVDREPLGTWVPPYDDGSDAVELGSGFPTSVGTLPPGHQVVVARMGLSPLAFYRGQELARNDLALGWAVDPLEEHIDVVTTATGAFILGTATRSLYRADAFQTVRIAGPNAPLLRNPRRLALTSDSRLLVSDRQREAVIAMDATSGETLGILADIRAAGYRGTDGIAITQTGELLVSASTSDAILAFSLESGAFLGARVRPRQAGLDDPRHLLVVPQLLDRFPDDPQRVMRPNAGLWSDPVSDGRGFDIEVFGDRLTAIWYTYDADGLPTWYLATSTLEGFSFSAPLLRFALSTEGLSDFSEIGTLTLEFDSERRAQAHWQVGAEAGTDQLRWLEFSAEPAGDDATGLWGQADGPGWGMSLAQQGDLSVLIAFIFDGDGEPRWLLSDAASDSGLRSFSMSALFSDSLCPGCTGEPGFNATAAGSMQFTPGAPGDWSSRVDLPAPMSGTWTLDAVPVIRFSESPQRPR